MKTVRFITDDLHQKEFAATVRKRVHTYFKEKGISVKGDSRMLLKAITMLSLYIGAFVLILLTPYKWLALILTVIMGIGEGGIGMAVMHDAAHGAFSDKKWVNSFFAHTMYILGSSTFNWKVQHNILHHTFTNIYSYDQDIETKSIIRLCEHAPMKKIHRFQHIYAFFLYGLMTFVKLFGDFKQLQDFNKSGITKELHSSPAKEITKLLISKAIYLTVILGLPFILTDFKWWQIMLGFAIMHITAGIIMSTIFQMAHVVEGTRQPLPNDQGIIETEWAVHQLQTTSDFGRNNRILSWYAGGLNFQIEHHLFPHVCHIHYKDIAPIVQQTAQEFGYEYNLKPSFAAALVSHAKQLRNLGMKREYAKKVTVQTTS